MDLQKALNNTSCGADGGKWVTIPKSSIFLSLLLRQLGQQGFEFKTREGLIRAIEAAGYIRVFSDEDATSYKLA